MLNPTPKTPQQKLYERARERYECAQADSWTYATLRHSEEEEEERRAHFAKRIVERSGTGTEPNPNPNRKRTQFACKIKKNNQNFTKTKLQGYQNGKTRRTYVSVNSIAAEFQSEGPNPKPSQFRADKLLHNITKSLEPVRESNQQQQEETRPPSIVILRHPVREKFANIFYRKRKKKSNQKVSLTNQQNEPSLAPNRFNANLINWRIPRKRIS